MARAELKGRGCHDPHHDRGVEQDRSNGIQKHKMPRSCRTLGVKIPGRMSGRCKKDGAKGDQRHEQSAEKGGRAVYGFRSATARWTAPSRKELKRHAVRWVTKTP